MLRRKSNLKKKEEHATCRCIVEDTAELWFPSGGMNLGCIATN